MKKITTLIFLLSSLLSFAQKNATITLTTAKPEQAIVSLVLEDVHFHPNLGIGLADTKLEPLAMINFQEKTSERVTAVLSEPKIIRLQYSGGGVNKTWMLFIQPEDDLTATFSGIDVTFLGKNAPYQDFLKSYFLENQYQYLPVFGYKPSQIDNKSVAQQSDSLQKVRQTAYAAFKTSQAPVPAFDAYVNATTTTEPFVIHRLLQEKIMRRNRAKKLEPAQQKELEDLTLNNFKLLPDEALLSQSYRDELRNWVLIPTTRKYPLDSATRYELSPKAITEVYHYSREKLQNHPKQQEYLLTYWLNYAATAIPTMETSQTLLADYKTKYPKSEHTEYFTKLLETKSKLTAGSMAPDFNLLDRDSVAISLKQLEGKPTVMIFAFNIGAHEPGMKAMETKYANKVNFAYITMIFGMSFQSWKPYSKARNGVKHLWASEENTELLKQKYAVDIRYPFLVLDASGKIVDRWIPQEFPNNKTLERTIIKALGK
jgi:peroxiredoxin